MEILGVHIGGLVFWQVVTTGAIVTVYALTVITNHRRLARDSFASLVIMASFVLKNSEAPDIPSLMGVREGTPIGNAGRLHDRVLAFRETGDASGAQAPPERFEKTTRIAVFVVMGLLAPVFQALTPLERWRLRGRVDVFAANPTQVRNLRLATSFAAFAVSLGYGVLWAYVGDKSRSEVTATVATTLVVIAGLLAVWAVAEGLLVIQHQVRWKEFWDTRLLDIMGQAERNDDHDLFNRASLLRAGVRAEPDVPIPGTTGFYTGLFAVVQILLLWLSDNL